ncbi:hypothetical protein ACIP6Q_37615 [Streptomyces bobili]|uniref:hypothetical protein n=1 Tax=Streptomyces bobili TaxID=67280 RepID=UPI0036E84796
MELLQLRGKLRDPLLGRAGLRGDLPLPFLQPCRHRAEDELITPHAVCQGGAVALVSRRGITAIIVRYTRDSEVRG